MNTAAEFAALDLMLRKNEGVRKSVYKDSIGLPTIGVGFNLRRNDASERMHAIGTSLEAVLSGKVLSSTQVDLLLKNDIDDVVKDLRGMFFDFDLWPLDAQLVMADLRFNLGPTRLRLFKTTLESFRNKKFHKAAIMLQGSLWARQVGPRAARSIQMLMRCPNGKNDP